MSVTRIDLGHGVNRHIPPAHDNAEDTRDVDWSAAAQSALRQARDLGFVRAGVASLEPFEAAAGRLSDFIEAGFSEGMDYLQRREEDGTLTRADPKVLLRDASVALVVALPYAAPNHAPHQAGVGRIAAYAQGEDYHGVIRQLLLVLADRLAEELNREIVARVCVDSAPILERDLAQRAGLSFFGKNTLAIAPGAGSHFLLGELLLNVPLTKSTTPPPDGCGSCTLCLDACPTDAFVGAYRLDATKCISFLTIESPLDIPRDLRSRIGDRLFGCDECQSVCPYNAKGAARPSHPGLAPKADLFQPLARDFLELTSSGYRRLVKGTALRRASRHQLARNAAVVMGNSGSAASVQPLLKQARSHASESVRRHAAWALKHLADHFGITEAHAALDALRDEGDPIVLEELEA